jgi:hypothetical protein
MATKKMKFKTEKILEFKEYDAYFKGSLFFNE